MYLIKIITIRVYRFISILIILIALKAPNAYSQKGITINEYLKNNGGFKVEGQFRDGIGRYIHTGDINGDGLSDVLLRRGRKTNSGLYGSFYILFGQRDIIDSTLTLSEEFDFGFRFDGEEELSIYDSGIVEDLNSDGIDELYFSYIKTLEEGEKKNVIEIVYGKEGFGLTDIDLNKGDTSRGFTLQTKFSFNVDIVNLKVGDVNNDGFTDLLFLAPLAPHSDVFGDHGILYVIFGNNAFFGNIKLDELDGSNGFTFSYDFISYNGGSSSLEVGDINGDGSDDILISNPHMDSRDENSGEFYMLFGSKSMFNSDLTVSDLDGGVGIVFWGDGVSQGVGYSPTMDDFNGDGLKDFAVGGPGILGNQRYGRIYLVYGNEIRYDNPQLIKNYISSKSNSGFYYTSPSKGDKFGFSLKLANFNDDEFKDLIFSAPESGSDGISEKGTIFLIFGTDHFQFISNTEISDLSKDHYLIISGSEENENLGSIIESGDFNGDGLDDLMIGTQDDLFDPNSEENGWIYILYGNKIGQHVNLELEKNIPSLISLLQNYPNPFNPTTLIKYELSENSLVELSVFDMLGRKVATLVNRRVEAGYHEVNFDASRLASGVYIYQLHANGNVLTQKMTLIK